MVPAIFLAFVGGALPAFVWIFFWLMEDTAHPEPKRYIFFTFMAGVLAVPLVLPFEEFAAHYVAGTALIVCWALFEEIFKFGAAYFAALRAKVFDEPVDAVIYMVTAALGFSATENALFLFTPLYQGEGFNTLVIGGLRFMGATLLHTLASITVGFCIAFAFSKSANVRRWAAVGGVILAAALHACFNFFILQGGGAMFGTFVVLWVGIIIALLLVERVKQPIKNYS